MIEVNLCTALKLVNGTNLSGSILFFENWPFKDGSRKDKLLLIIKCNPNTNQAYILILTSQVDKYVDNPFYRDKIFYLSRSRVGCLNSDSLVFINQIEQIDITKFTGTPCPPSIGCLPTDVYNQLLSEIELSRHVSQIIKAELRFT